MRKLASAESLAGLVGLALVVLGAVGFVPGAVRDYGALHWCGIGSTAELFGAFQTSIVLNLARLGFGVAGLVAGRAAWTARLYLSAGGALVFAFGIYGLLIDRLGSSNAVPVNRADDWLHLGLGVAMLYAGTAVVLAGLRPAAPS